MDKDELLAEIAAFLKWRGLRESTFGRYSVNNPYLLDTIRNGGVSLNTVERVREYIARERGARDGHARRLKS